MFFLQPPVKQTQRYYSPKMFLRTIVLFEFHIQTKGLTDVVFQLIPKLHTFASGNDNNLVIKMQNIFLCLTTVTTTTIGKKIPTLFILNL